MASGLPTGTVTFLFTDIEGSTQIAQRHRDVWEKLQARHHAILRLAIETHKGYIFQVIGDAFCAAFHQPGDALRAALHAQRDLRTEPWGSVAVRVRMGIHTGLANPEGNDYRGYLALSSVQRVMSAAHGGQVLLSQGAYDLIEGDLPDEAGLRDRGLHRLKDLLQPQHLYQLVVADLPSDFPPLKSLEARPHNLPIQLTSFVGREKEIQALSQLIGSARLVTLTGAGGTGKTRLAVQIAAEILDEFRDGVWLTELAPLSDPALVPQAIAKALNVQEQPGRPFVDVLKDYLRTKDLLLILDNCEHLLEPCAEVADALLHAAPNIRILVTGREALGIMGETTFPVRSLPLPNPGAASAAAVSQSDSVRLFTERAVAVQPVFQVSDQNAGAVAQICTRLDGIPLAIELAAARVKGLGVEEISSRLDDRFRLLTGGSRTALPRHRTLQGAIDWSYNLLSDDERLTLRRLSVFAGGWTLSAAEAVCAGEGIEADQVLDLLTHLVDKSLVVMDQGPRVARYRMLETIREYARERFSNDRERATAHEKHCDFCIALAEEAYAARDIDSRTWLQRLEMEHDNMRAALDWASSHARERELQLAGALGWFWIIHGHFAEGRRRLIDALQTDGEDTRVVIRALLAAGDMAVAQGDCGAASAHLETALALARQSGERSKIAKALRSLGECRLSQGDYRAAQPVFEEALAIQRELGESLQTGRTLVGVGQAHSGQDNFIAARSAYEEAYSIALGVNDRRLLEMSDHCMADVALLAEDYQTAAARYAEALILGREFADIGQMTFELEGLGMAAAGAEEPERALRLAGAAIAIRESLGTTLTWDWWEAAKDRWLGQARRALGAEASAALWAEGRAMTLEQAFTYALERDKP